MIIFVADSLLGEYWSLPIMRQFFYHQTTTTNKQTNIPKKDHFSDNAVLRRRIDVGASNENYPIVLS